MGDKISNCESLLNVSPVGWSKERVRDYFIWSEVVCDNLRGSNELLDKHMESILVKSGIATLSKEEKMKHLSEYYESLIVIK